MDRTKVGFGLVGVAGLLWLAVAISHGGGDGLYLGGLVLASAGAFVAAPTHDARPRVAAAGLAAVALGVVMFYDGAIFVTGLSSVAGGIYAAGAALAAVALATGRKAWLVAGAAVAAAGAAFWIYTDGLEAATSWQPGNVLAALAWAVVAIDARE